ncbi:MAG: DUF2877 domain-containing protein [Candidatus Tectomicrobia bacterium]|nr:DUF2877 domain-containing protein [Candidatus Tectomicrobia bacterium]
MIPVLVAGAAARRALAPHGAGKVLAVFRRSIYLEREDGALACLGPPALGAGPLNALCGLPEGFDWEERGLAPGAPFMCGEEAVRVAGGVSFSLRDARAWRARLLPPDWGPADLAGGLAALARTARPPAEGLRPPKGLWPPKEGMGRLIAELILPPVRRRGEAPGSADLPSPAGVGFAEAGGYAGGSCLAPTDRQQGERSLFLHAARAGALALGEWLREALRGEPSPPREEAGRLLGLGPGLTPSGDDFVGGAMVALRALGEGRAADRLAAWALPLAAERTGKISLAHLACAAAGKGASALHDALAALCAPGAPGLAEALAAVHAIGHTSGWDALAGAAGACAARLSARGFGEGIRTRPGFEGRAPAPL